MTRTETADESATESAMRVLTYNVRYELNDVGSTAWDRRREAVLDTIATAAPDIVCLQEVWKDQLADIESGLPDYEWVGARDGREHTVIGYRPAEFRVLDRGWEWLAEDGAEPGTPGWDARYQKRFTYATLERSGSGAPLCVFSVHLHFTGDTAPSNGMELVRERMTAVADGAPAMLAGDLNTQPGDPTYELGAAPRQDLRDLVYASQRAGAVTGPEHTFTGFPGEDEVDQDIDHVLVTPDVGVERVETVRPPAETDSFRPSDHRPVLATVTVDPASGVSEE